MAPRPKTYGARRSYAKPVRESMNGITANESEQRIRKIDAISMKTGNGKDKDLRAAPKEEKQYLLSQVLRKEDESASGIADGQRATPSRTPNLEDMSTTVSTVSRSLRNKRKSAQDMLPPDTSITEPVPRRKGTKGSVNGSEILEAQDLITKTGLQSISIDCNSSSHVKASSCPTGLIEDHQQSPDGHDFGLTGIPNDLHNLAFWVAQLIRKQRQANSPLSTISGPWQEDPSPRPGHDIEMSALENVEDVRMTRGKEKKRLQQLKGKEPAHVPNVDLSGKFVTGVGKALRSKDAAPVERILKEKLNDKLKQKLFGSSSTTNLSANVIERNACGKLLFNTIADIGESATGSSAAVLNSALEERKDDAPFLSALNILASSSEVMAFINFVCGKDGKDATSRWEASNADDSRPSTGLETSGATTITDTSDLTSRTGISRPEAEALFKNASSDQAMDSKHPERQKQSQEVIQALEAATMILIQIQQGETGTGYITPYACGSMVSNPTGQPHSASNRTAYGPPHANHPVHGMAYGPPMGVKFNNYASPYAPPLAVNPASYASPYSNPVNQPPANYASPYANPMAPNQASRNGILSSVINQANKHDGQETHHDKRKNHTPYLKITWTEAKKGNDEAAGHYISNEEDETSKAYDEATRRDIDNGNEVASHAVNLDETIVDDAKNKEGGGDDENLSSGDDLPPAKPDDKNVTPPAEDHKLFTGERLGDFTSMEKIDWLLTMSNGGEISRPSKKRRTRSPSISPSSPADAEIQAEVGRIINEITFYKDWHGHPISTSTTKQLFYASAEAQRLAAELRRLMAIAKPVVNTMMPSAESQARLRFYQHLESRAIKEKRDREIQEGMNRFYGAPVQIQQWAPPAGPSTVQLPMPPPLPSNGPMEVPFVRRGNVIAAPPGGRNVEEEKKAETYGYPPMPGSRPGDSPKGQKRKRTGRR